MLGWPESTAIFKIGEVLLTGPISNAIGEIIAGKRGSGN
jgi:hypothetical protein